MHRRGKTAKALPKIKCAPTLPVPGSYSPAARLASDCLEQKAPCSCRSSQEKGSRALYSSLVLIGDGGFHYNPVPSCLGLAQEYSLPITVVVFNNQRYLSMERGLLRYYPDGASKETGIHFGGPILPNPDYRHFADVYGGYGVRVKDPKDIQSAVAQSLEHNAAGRLAVIDVVLSDYLPRQ
jgi:TPP-dependent trihydroxycyclohexane-1,2-dione (THcHDO) dehydratase